MCPVIQGIAQNMWDGARPSEKFFPRLSIARAIALRHAMGAHGAPLVMVAFQPDLKQIRELSIARDVTRRQMTVIVEDRLLSCIMPVQMTSRLVLKKKIVGNESHIVVIFLKNPKLGE